MFVEFNLNFRIVDMILYSKKGRGNSEYVKPSTEVVRINQAHDVKRQVYTEGKNIYRCIYIVFIHKFYINYVITYSNQGLQQHIIHGKVGYAA